MLFRSDYQKLHRINAKIFAEPGHVRSWSRDPELVEKFINDMCAIPNLKYVHLLGGETLYDENFYTICEALIERGAAQNVIMGTTTNGTVYNERIEHIIRNFKEVHLGISIEAVSKLNDYIRYPSQVNEIKRNIERYLDLRADTGLNVIIRISPNIFSISSRAALAIAFNVFHQALNLQIKCT